MEWVASNVGMRSKPPTTTNTLSLSLSISRATELAPTECWPQISNYQSFIWRDCHIISHSLARRLRRRWWWWRWQSLLKCVVGLGFDWREWWIIGYPFCDEWNWFQFQKNALLIVLSRWTKQFKNWSEHTFLFVKRIIKKQSFQHM